MGAAGVGTLERLRIRARRIDCFPLYRVLRMGTFRELEEFERNFDSMDVAELERWKSYWTRHAQQLAPKVRKLAMKRVYDIEKAIEQKGGNEPGAPAIVIPETPPGSGLGPSPTQKSKARAGRIMYIGIPPMEDFYIGGASVKLFLPIFKMNFPVRRA